MATALALQTEPKRQGWERPGYLREWHNHAIAASLALLDAIREPPEHMTNDEWRVTWKAHIDAIVRGMIDALRREIESAKEG